MFSLLCLTLFIKQLYCAKLVTSKTNWNRQLVVTITSLTSTQDAHFSALVSKKYQHALFDRHMVCITNKLNESCKFDGLVKAFWRCANSHWVMPRKLYYSFCPSNWCGVSRVVLSCCGDLSMASSHCISNCRGGGITCFVDLLWRANSWS